MIMMINVMSTSDMHIYDTCMYVLHMYHVPSTDGSMEGVYVPSRYIYMVYHGTISLSHFWYAYHRVLFYFVEFCHFTFRQYFQSSKSTV